jgi:hypothetical protein
MDLPEADVLTLLDCCCALNATKGDTKTSRVYELLAACSFDEITWGPNPGSFTSVLIRVLNELLDTNGDEGVAVQHLIQRHKQLRTKPMAEYWNMLGTWDRTIVLTPVQKPALAHSAKVQEKTQSVIVKAKMSQSTNVRHFHISDDTRYNNDFHKAGDTFDVSKTKQEIQGIRVAAGEGSRDVNHAPVKLISEKEEEDIAASQALSTTSVHVQREDSHEEERKKWFQNRVEPAPWHSQRVPQSDRTHDTMEW